MRHEHYFNSCGEVIMHFTHSYEYCRECDLTIKPLNLNNDNENEFMRYVTYKIE